MGGARYRRAATEAAESENLTQAEADLLAVRLRLAVGATRWVAHGALLDAVEDGFETVRARAADQWITEPIWPVGAWLPVMPVPGYRYATGTVWDV